MNLRSGDWIKPRGLQLYVVLTSMVKPFASAGSCWATPRMLILVMERCAARGTAYAHVAERMATLAELATL